RGVAVHRRPDRAGVNRIVEHRGVEPRVGELAVSECLPGWVASPCPGLRRRDCFRGVGASESPSPGLRHTGYSRDEDPEVSVRPVWVLVLRDSPLVWLRRVWALQVSRPRAWQPRVWRLLIW